MTFVYDTFTDTNGTLLTAHIGEVGATWTQHPANAGQATIQDNRAYVSTAGTVYASGIPPGPDYDIEAEYHIITNVSTMGIIGRLSTSAVTGYLFRGSGAQWQLYRLIAGAATLLDSEPATLIPNTDYYLRLSLHGSTQRCFVNDVLVCEAADTQITDAGVVGIRDTSGTLSTSTTGRHLGMIRAYVPAAISYPILTTGSRPITMLSPHQE